MYQWFSDNLPGAIESIDDTGGCPDEDELEKAFIALGWKKMNKPEFRVVALDRTSCYDPDLAQRCGGTVYDIYLYDASRVTHCCEVTPSYECHYLYSQPGVYPDDDRQRERLLDGLDEANSCESHATFHCSAVDTVPFPSEFHAIVPVELDEPDADDDRTPEQVHKEWLNEALEYANANHLI